ncbi:TPA: hypothetical protein EYP66_25570 [Candidatus Poribacteria bacterium]|nr:hypothetical protein [Candidatus Poribacteria bacterium]
MMQIFNTYTEPLEHIEQKGHTPQLLGYAPDGAPLVSVKSGGEKEPAIFISAGSHSTEQAGVTAAVELIDQLHTEHQVYVIPTRDAMGMNGFAYVLSLSLGEEPNLGSIEDVQAVLREHGEVLYEADETLLVIIGEYGYSTRGLYGRFRKEESFLEPLKGRRIFFPSRAEGVEGTAPCQRAYTLIVSPEGEALHINRFHDTPWAPVEVRCTRRLMAEIQPGLTLDLHEYGGNAFWLSARHQQCDDGQMWEGRIAHEMIQAVAQSGTELAPADYLPGAFFTKGERGVFWLHAQKRGEGLNLADFAASKYGLSFTIETGMQRGFEQRVRAAMLAAQTAVTVFEQRYA